MKTTRLGFFGALFASVVAHAQTKIEACAPVYYRMPKPCPGQCPACGLAHGEITAITPPVIEGMFASSINQETQQVRVIRVCDHCSNAFGQLVPLDVFQARWK
jgi:hypothetical protein